MEKDGFDFGPEDLRSYDYALPEDLIAQAPCVPRDASRLLVLHRKNGKIEHRNFRDLPEYLNSNHLIVANNTKVLRARLLGNRVREVNGQDQLGGKVEFVMLEECSPLVWEGLFHASARYIPGLRFRVPTLDGKGLNGTLLKGPSESATGTVVVKFDRDPIASGAGELPLPHYIQRPLSQNDESSYQTVYAKNDGSAAAPTAGLHFTEEVISRIKAKNINWHEVTLHVGLGTFRPVKEMDVRNHKMHEEKYEISKDASMQIAGHKKGGGRILAIGTTTVRALESAASQENGALRIKEGLGRTALFIRPNAFQFQVIDSLLTNFHLPRSTLLMLVCALAGKDHALHAYKEAVKERYRFFSYGDAMLVL